MAKNTKIHSSRGFWIGMLVYALIFLAIAAGGLCLFWDFIHCYELSRPKNTVNAYVSQLDAAYLRRQTETFLAELDTDIQTEEEAFGVILDSLEEEITAAKKSSESTEARQVYVLRSGRQVIGQIAITVSETDKYGFSRWSVTEEQFDFTHLMGMPVSVTVPEDFTVMLNGRPLDASYITESGILYTALEDFSGDFEMPMQVTYQADAFLGEAVLVVLDRNGERVEITADTDPNQFLPQCQEEEEERVRTLVTDFVKRYVNFTGSANNAAAANYLRLKECLVPDGTLVQRLRTAIDGLQWAQSRGDTVRSIEIHQTARLSEQRFYCDLTYVVSTIGKKGAVETTTNMKLILLETEAGLKVEAMTVY